MADVLDVAAAIVDEATATGIDPHMTTKKLQKMVYYSQVWYLVETGETLFEDSIEAWTEGPVVRRLWYEHRGSFSANGIRLGVASRLSSKEASLVSRVVDRYGRLTAAQLIELTHRETPWQSARVGLPDGFPSSQTIDVELIRKSYAHGVPSPTEAVNLAIASSRLEGLLTDDEFLPTLDAVARGELDVERAVRARISQLQD